MSSSSTATECGFAGNSDIYGLGIRIGYYAQVFAIYLSNFFVLSEAKNLRAPNALFLLALAIVTLIYSHNAASTQAIEVFILLQMGLCLAIVSLLDGTRYSSKRVRVNKGRIFVRTVLANFGIFYNFYFWWWGLDSMKRTPCGTYAFYFVRADLYGPMRTAMKVFAVTGLTWRTMFITTWDLGMVIRDFKLRRVRASFVKQTQQRWLGEQRKDVINCRDCRIRREQADHVEPKERKTTSADEIAFSGREKENHTSAEAARQHIHQIDFREVLISRSPTIVMDSSDEPTFEAVLEAENYLNEIFSKTSSLPEVTLEAAIRGTIKASFADASTRRIKDTLSTHSQALSLPISQWPRTVNRMLELNTHQGANTPHWEILTIASDIQLEQIPVIKPLMGWLWLAAQNFVITVLLTVQIELTISWNGIYGLAEITTVGQLFPLCLGLGGLVKVFWQKGVRLWKGKRSAGHKKEIKRPSKYELALDKYLEWKERRMAVSVPE